jgi:hypothetical protein
MPKACVLSTLVLVGACAHPSAAPYPPAPANPPSAAAPRTQPFALIQPVSPLLAEITAAERASAARPDDAVSWGRLAAALKRANRLQEAARAAWRAVELAPSVESWTALGHVLIQGGAPQGATAAFEEVSRETNDGFLAAQNFIALGYRAWLWGLDDMAMSLYARADELAPGHPQTLFNRTLLLAAAGKTATAQAEATRLRNVVDRVLEDRPPLEMVEILEPMKALTESVINGEAIERRSPQSEPGQRLPERFWRRDPGQSRALDLAIDQTAERFYPIAGWHLLVLTAPSGWIDTFEVKKGEPAQIRLETSREGVRPMPWLMTATRTTRLPELDRLVLDEQRSLAGVASLGAVRALVGRDLEGRCFIADSRPADPGDRDGFPRMHIAVLRVGDMLVTAKRFLHDRDPGVIDETENILRNLQVRDLTPPRRQQTRL